MLAPNVCWCPSGGAQAGMPKAMIMPAHERATNLTGAPSICGTMNKVKCSPAWQWQQRQWGRQDAVPSAGKGHMQQPSRTDTLG